MTAAQQRSARLLGQGYTSRAVARRLGISERTLRTWKRLLGFAELVERERREAGDPDAREVLHQLLHSDNETVRLRAAVALLSRPGEPEDEQPAVLDGAIVVHPAALELAADS
jgi:transposase-like protein